MNKKIIDVIVPVYKNLELTVACLKSLILYTNFDYYDIKVVIVNDTGNDIFSHALSNLIKDLFIDHLMFFNIINHGKNLGFIEACYTGIGFRDSDYKILLNSDTCVTANWLEPLIKLADSDSSIALVNPVSNNAPIIDIPIPVGANINLMRRWLMPFNNDEGSIDIVTAVGFCLLIKTKYIKLYGFFDRVYGKGYCEETDLYFRYINQGLRAVIAVDSFVYHKGEASFKDKSNRLLENEKIMWKRYRHIYDSIFPFFNKYTILNKMRNFIKRKTKYEFDVCIISPSANIKSGGVKILHQICNELNLYGISCGFITTYDDKFNNHISDALQLYKPIHITDILNKKISISTNVFLYSLWENIIECNLLNKMILFSKSKLKFINILQDIEGFFPHSNYELWKNILNYNDFNFAVSPFIKDFINNNKLLNYDVPVIYNKFSLQYYEEYLFSCGKKRNVDILAMSRADVFRGSLTLERIINILALNIDKKIKIVTYGDFDLKIKHPLIDYHHVGVISEVEVSHLMAQSRIFMETSQSQGFGLCLVEAILSGCHVVSTANAGVISLLEDKYKIMMPLISLYHMNDLEKAVKLLVNNLNEENTVVQFNKIMHDIAVLTSNYSNKCYVDYIQNIKLQKSAKSVYKLNILKQSNNMRRLIKYKNILKQSKLIRILIKYKNIFFA